MWKKQELKREEKRKRPRCKWLEETKMTLNRESEMLK